MRATEAGEDSPKMIWAGRILTVLTALFHAAGWRHEDC
jgi:hypothetical protein